MPRKPAQNTVTHIPASQSPLLRLIGPQVSVSDINCNMMGDVSFRVDIAALNLSRSDVVDDPLGQRRSFIDFVGVELVMRNLDRFADLMVSKKDIYEKMCFSYRHESFGLMIGSRYLELRFHVSLLCWIINLQLAGEIAPEHPPRQQRTRTKKQNGIVVDKEQFTVMHHPVKFSNPSNYSFSATFKTNPDVSGLMRDITSCINHGLKQVGEQGISITLTQQAKSILINLVRSFF